MAHTPMRIVLVTSSYPYGTEEEFPAQEASRWPLDRVAVTVAPLKKPGPVNPMPPGVELDPRLADHRTPARKMLSTAAAALHPLMMREVVSLARARSLSPARLLAALRVVGQTLLVRRGLEQVLGPVGPDVVVYTYWHSAATYAAVLLKRAGRVRAVVSRGHGSDVYEAIAPAQWHALKRQLAGEVDHTWTVSESGATELADRYGVDPARVSVSRLGVVVPPTVGPEPRADVFRILSVSTCTPLKQVPLIARAVGALADEHPGTAIHWTHLGDGPGLEELRELFARLRTTRPGLDGSLPGFVAHVAVEKLLRTQPFDVMVNASTSEGVPVSIMETMSYGIPTIAPAVGGVPELVRPETGWLLPTPVSEEALTRALGTALAERTQPGRRRASRALVERQFDSEANYRAFAEELVRRSRVESA